VKKMARQNGELRTCDRCGVTKFFKTIGDCVTDGGYTRWNKFEEAKGWTTERDIGDLCPECSEVLENIKKKFKQKVDEFKNKE
jgi:hypothetical protein